MDDIGTKIRNAIRSKKLDMQEAADKLEMSRSALYNKLNARDIENEFLELLEERLGINLNNAERSSSVVVMPERKLGDVAMKYHTIPLKKKRVAEMWLPEDADAADIATIEKYLKFYESTL